MAATAQKKTINPNDELVEYKAPLIGVPNKRDILVAVNGETIRIKRGVPVKIKRKFLKVLNQAADQEMAAYKTMEQAQQQAHKAMAQL